MSYESELAEKGWKVTKRCKTCGCLLKTRFKKDAWEIIACEKKSGNIYIIKKYSVKKAFGDLTDLTNKVNELAI